MTTRVRRRVVASAKGVADLGQGLALVAVAVELLDEASAVSVAELDRDHARLQIKDVQRV